MDIFQKNLDALKQVNYELVEKITAIKSNERFEVFQGDSATAINIFDKEKNVALYENPVKDYEKFVEDFKKFEEYPFLYIFGAGNGLEIEHLLSNQKLTRVVIIEPEEEILYIIFNLVDLSEHISSKKVIFLLPEQLDFSTSLNIFNNSSKFYAKVYDLLILLPYYGNYKDDILKTNQILIDGLTQIVHFAGNDAKDSIVGLKHHIENIPQMLKSGKFSDLMTKKNSDIAIIVSTGPSLAKQLSLLKKIQNSVTIVCVDASLPVLEKHGIKPDIVTSIERVVETSKFFKNSSEEFQKDIIAVSASLQHKETMNANKCRKVIAMRPFNYNRYLGPDDYGYIGAGMSSANLAHEVAIAMQYKRIVFIGQDLAFGKDGTSHSKDHIFGEDEVDSKKVSKHLVEAYGGEGTVQTTIFWMLFKNSIEHFANLTKEGIETINATEGGARIKNTTELTFNEVIEKYVNPNFKKKPITLKISNIHQYKKDLKTIKKRVYKAIKDGEEIYKKIEETFLKLHEASMKLENISKEDALDKFSMPETAYLLYEIENIREEIRENEIINKFYYIILQSDILHTEAILSTIKVKKVDSQKSNQEKALQWILINRELLYVILGILNIAIETIKDAKKGWDR